MVKIFLIERKNIRIVGKTFRKVCKADYFRENT